jgi:hypothetical protein
LPLRHHRAPAGDRLDVRRSGLWPAPSWHAKPGREEFAEHFDAPRFGPPGGAFTSTGTQHGGQEATLFSIIANLLHFGMVVVGLDYGYAPQMRIDAVTGGSPYGATTIAGGDGLRQPSDDELMGARYQGHRIAEVAKRLHDTASLFEPPCLAAQ